MIHKEYAVYKGDTLLAMGTREECAKQLGVLPDTVTFYGTPTYKNRVEKRKSSSGNVRVLVKLGKPDEFTD